MALGKVTSFSADDRSVVLDWKAKDAWSWRIYDGLLNAGGGDILNGAEPNRRSLLLLKMGIEQDTSWREKADIAAGRQWRVAALGYSSEPRARPTE